MLYFEIRCSVFDRWVVDGGAISENLVVNGDFSDRIAGWETDLSVDLVSGRCCDSGACVDLQGTGGKATLSQSVDMTNNNTLSNVTVYRLSFAVCGNWDNPFDKAVTVSVIGSGSNTTYLNETLGPITQADGLQYFTFFFQIDHNAVDDSRALLSFKDASYGCCSWGALLDSVVMQAFISDCSPLGECCGDTLCGSVSGDSQEPCNSCPNDCGDCCGNGKCEPFEDCTSCFQDCELDLCCTVDTSGPKGCTNRAAWNFDPNAQIDDGSCDYGSDLVFDNNEITDLPRCDLPFEITFNVTTTHVILSQVALGLQMTEVSSLNLSLTSPDSTRFDLFIDAGSGCSFLNWFLSDDAGFLDLPLDNFSSSELYCGLTESESGCNSAASCGRFFSKHIFVPEMYAFFQKEALGLWSLRICGSGRYRRSQLSFPQFVEINPSATCIPDGSVVSCPDFNSTEFLYDPLSNTTHLFEIFEPDTRNLSVGDYIFGSDCGGFIVNITSISANGGTSLVEGYPIPFTFVILRGKIDEILLNDPTYSRRRKTIRSVNFQIATERKKRAEYSTTISAVAKASLSVDLKREKPNLDLTGTLSISYTEEVSLRVHIKIEANPDWPMTCFFCSPSLVKEMGATFTTVKTFTASLGFTVQATFTLWEDDKILADKQIAAFTVFAGPVPIPMELRTNVEFEPPGTIEVKGSYTSKTSKRTSWIVPQDGQLTYTSTPASTTKEWNFAVSIGCQITVTPSITGALILALWGTGTGPALTLKLSSPVVFGPSEDCCDGTDTNTEAGISLKINLGLGLEINEKLLDALDTIGFSSLRKLQGVGLSSLWSFTPFSIKVCAPLLSIEEGSLCDLCSATRTTTDGSLTQTSGISSQVSTTGTTASLSSTTWDGTTRTTAENTISQTVTDTYTTLDGTNTISVTGTETRGGDPCYNCTCDCNGCTPALECTAGAVCKIPPPPDCEPAPPCDWCPPGGPSGGWGDPHLTSWDGCQFNFQGRGEYSWLLVDGGEEVSMQARQVPYGNGAAIVNAIVVRFQMGEKVALYDPSYLPSRLMIDGSPFHLSVGCKYSLSNGYILRQSSNEWVIKYSNGFVTTAICRPRGGGQCYFQISSSVPAEYANRTSGILGFFDYNQDQEFPMMDPATNTTVYLSCNTDDRTIFSAYEGLFLVQKAASLFDYLHGDDNMFYDDLQFSELRAFESAMLGLNKNIPLPFHTKRQGGDDTVFEVEPNPLAVQYCQSIGDANLRESCIFDGSIAVNSHMEEDLGSLVQGVLDYQQAEQSTVTISNRPPAFTSALPEFISVIVPETEEISMHFVAVDPEGKEVVLKAILLPPTATFVSGFFHFSLPRTTAEYSVEISATDVENATATSHSIISVSFNPPTGRSSDSGSTTETTETPTSDEFRSIASECSPWNLLFLLLLLIITGPIAP